MNERFNVVCCLHGDEPLPLYAAVAAGARPIIGNPDALVRRQRFIEKDLNACFGEEGKTLEHRRAASLLRELDPRRPVIDLHTFSCRSEPFCIVVDDSMIPLARRTGIKHVIVMRYNIKNGHALINSRAGISVEVGSHDDPRAYQTAIEVLRSLDTGAERMDISVYESIGTLETPCGYENLSMTPDGWLPLLAGERAYQHHGIKVVPVV